MGECKPLAQRPKKFYLPFYGEDFHLEINRLPYLDTGCRAGIYGDNRDYAWDPRVDPGYGELNWAFIAQRETHCDATERKCSVPIG